MIKRQIKKFLGLCSFYRNLIPAYAELADPLVKLTSPSKSFKWTEVEDNSFQKLEKVFFKEPFLQRPDYNKMFYLNTDTSHTQQVLFSEAQRNHSSQTLTSPKPLEKLKPDIRQSSWNLWLSSREPLHSGIFFYDRQFTILSDSKPLDKSKKSTSPTGIK